MMYPSSSVTKTVSESMDSSTLPLLSCPFQVHNDAATKVPTIKMRSVHVCVHIKGHAGTKVNYTVYAYLLVNIYAFALLIEMHRYHSHVYECGTANHSSRTSAGNIPLYLQHFCLVGLHRQALHF